jgi:hypothetical protein
MLELTPSQLELFKLILDHSERGQASCLAHVAAHWDYGQAYRTLNALRVLRVVTVGRRGRELLIRPKVDLEFIQVQSD